MKLLALVLPLLLAATAAKAEPSTNVCGASALYESNGQILAVEPKLQVRRSEMEYSYIPFVTEAALVNPTEFSTNLCQLCQWGSKGLKVALQGPPPAGSIVAILNHLGQMESIDRYRSGNISLVDSLSCSN